MGATRAWEADAITVAGPARLGGIDADLNAISDTAPTLAVLGAPSRARRCTSATSRTCAGRRATACAPSPPSSARLGARVEERDDGISVWPSPLHAARSRTYDDHRIAMAFALAGLRVPGIRIADPGCVGKTFPDYLRPASRRCADDGSETHHRHRRPGRAPAKAP